MSRKVFSFCYKCECYHVDFKKSNFRMEYETHLNDREKREAITFNVYKKKVNGMNKTLTSFIQPSEMLRIYNSGDLESYALIDIKKDKL